VLKIKLIKNIFTDDKPPTMDSPNLSQAQTSGKTKWGGGENILSPGQNQDTQD
jgi:hypothetical protein